MDPFSVFLLILVSILWGFTNPLMKKGSEGIEKCTDSSSWVKSFLNELSFLLVNWKYLSAFLLNQLGSMLYYYSLGQSALSIAGPLTNTLTFVFTYISGTVFFGEKDETENPRMKKCGLILICSGVFLCLLDKL